MPSGGKVHKSLRIDADTAERVRALVRDGESEASAYNRVLAAGLNAMECGAGKVADDAGSAHGDGGDAMRAVLETVAALRDQLSVKDEQIRALTGLVEQSQTIAKQSQQLHAMAEAKALPVERDTAQADERDVDDGRRGWWSRRFGRRHDR